MKSITTITPKNISIAKRIALGTSCLMLVAITLLVPGETVHAGLFSYLFGGEQASAKSNTSYGGNSQTIALLQPVNAHDPNPEKPAGVVPVNGGMLVADIALADAYIPDTSSTQISSYTVREGDTLSTIAKMFGVSVNTIVWANNISKSSPLKSGQVLIILPVTGINYTIKKGDTIKGIAGTFKADIDEILQYNDLDLDSTLVVGQAIIIPDAEQPLVQTKSATKTNFAHDTGGPNYAGYYVRPINGGTKTQGLHGYNGVDLASYKGAPIYAAAAGTVILSSNSGWNGGYGNLVIISHANGTQTVYGHLSKSLVSVGQRVDQGEQIALMGNTGKVAGVTGVHLHFEIRGAKNPF